MDKSKIQKNITKINEYVSKGENVVAFFFVAIIIFLLIYSIVIKSFPDIISESVKNSFSSFFQYSFIISFCAILLFALLKYALSFFVKDEDEIERERIVNDIVEGVMARKTKEAKSVKTEVYSPLRDLTEQQEHVICDLLQNLPAHASISEQINMSEVAQFLTALQRMNYLDGEDKRNLRNWVREVSGREVPSVSAFNEAYPSGNNKKVKHYEEMIVKKLNKIR